MHALKHVPRSPGTPPKNGESPRARRPARFEWGRRDEDSHRERTTSLGSMSAHHVTGTCFFSQYQIQSSGSSYCRPSPGENASSPLRFASRRPGNVPPKAENTATHCDLLNHVARAYAAPSRPISRLRTRAFALFFFDALPTVLAIANRQPVSEGEFCRCSGCGFFPHSSVPGRGNARASRPRPRGPQNLSCRPNPGSAATINRRLPPSGQGGHGRAVSNGLPVLACARATTQPIHQRLALHPSTQQTTARSTTVFFLELSPTVARGPFPYAHVGAFAWRLTFDIGGWFFFPFPACFCRVGPTRYSTRTDCSFC